MKENPLIIVLGPTASGKTKLAVQLADALNGEIISADSRQVFKGMDIGTGKDLKEYELEGHTVPHHLIDICEAGERYNVNSFKEDFYKAFNQISSAGKLPVLCGGTGMYVHSILQQHDFTSIPVNTELRTTLLPLSIHSLRERLSGYPAELTSHADQTTHKRLIRAIEIAEFLKDSTIKEQERQLLNPFVIGLTEDVAARRKKIYDRLERRFDEGLIAEVELLLLKGVPAEMLIFYGLEYKMIVAYIKQELTYAQLREQLYHGICQYAKRQMTFFRKMEKDGVNIRWYQADTPLIELKNAVLADVKTFF